MDRHTHELFDMDYVPASPEFVPGLIHHDVVESVQSPTITMTVVPMSSNVYSIVQDRSIALLKLITEPDPDLANAEDLGELAAASVRTFVAIRKLRKARTKSALQSFIHSMNNKSVDQEAMLMELRRIIPEAEESGHLENADTAKQWWDTVGKDWQFDPTRYLLFNPTPDTQSTSSNPGSDPEVHVGITSTKHQAQISEESVIKEIIERLSEGAQDE